MRATLTTASVIALLAAGAGSAAARPDVPEGRTDAAVHAIAMRSLGLQHPALTKAEAPVVHITRQPLIDGGFQWADAGIGAGLALVLLVSAAGVSAVRRHPPTTVR